MKTYIYTALLALSTLVFSSCKDFLYVEPTNVLTVNSYDDVRSLMGAQMKIFREANDWYNRSIIIPYYHSHDELILEFYSDDLLMSHYLEAWTGANNRGDYEKSLDWQHPTFCEDIWEHYYSSIGYNNMILDQLAKFEAPSTEKLNEVKGEALVIRAYCMFKLMQLFSPYHEAELGLPLNTDADKVGSYDKRRWTQQENYSFIIDNLTEALKLGTKPSESFNFFYDPNIIHALLAQVYLYKGDSGAKEEGDYAHAVEHARAALKGSGITSKVLNRMPGSKDDFGYTKSSGYALISMITYDARHQEVAGIPSWEQYEYATPELVALFPDNDLRRKVFFQKDEKNNLYYITKFNDQGFYGTFTKVDLFTAAELELIVAEALARQDKESEAEQALRVFTANRYSGEYKRPEGKSLVEAILEERRKEFCFERTYRWEDLTRLQRGFSRRVRYRKEDKTFTMKDGDYRFCLPIPQIAELSENKIEQNPGWAIF